MAKVYEPQKINSTTQIPEAANYGNATKGEMPYAVANIVEEANASAVTGLDTQACQICYDATAGKINVSPIGQSTYTVVITSV